MSTQPGTSLSISSGVVCCLIGSEQFALRADDVQVVARADRMVAGSGPDGRIGVLRHADTAVPVFSLASILGLGAAIASPAAHIVVSRTGRGAFGLLVDRAVRTGRRETLDVFPLPRVSGPQARRWFAGLLHAGELSCLLMSPEGIQPGPCLGSGAGSETVRNARGQQDRTAAPQAIAVLFSSAAIPARETTRYALGARQIAAVVQTLPSVALPGAPPFVQSIGLWRRAAVPIVDFRDEASRQRAARHLIARTGDGGLVAIGVDGDITLHHNTAEDRFVSTSSAAFVRGVFAIGDERVSLLDVDALIGSGESEGVALAAS